MRILKWCVFALVLLCIAGVIMYNVPWRHEVNITESCMIWNEEDRTQGKLEEIEIKGVYIDYLFKDDEFRGTMVITGVNEDDVREFTVPLQNYKNVDLTVGGASYWSVKKDSLVNLGFFYVEGVFEKMLLMLSTDEQKGNYLCVPASNMEEALAIEEYFQRFFQRT